MQLNAEVQESMNQLNAIRAELQSGINIFDPGCALCPRLVIFPKAVEASSKLASLQQSRRAHAQACFHLHVLCAPCTTGSGILMESSYAGDSAVLVQGSYANSRLSSSCNVVSCILPQWMQSFPQVSAGIASEQVMTRTLEMAGKPEWQVSWYGLHEHNQMTAVSTKYAVRHSLGTETLAHGEAQQRLRSNAVVRLWSKMLYTRPVA